MMIFVVMEKEKNQTQKKESLSYDRLREQLLLLLLFYL